MSKTDLRKLFGLEPKKGYWTQQVSPGDNYMSEIHVYGLPPGLNRNRIIQQFAQSLLSTNPSKDLAFIPGEDDDGKIPPGTSLILLFSAYIPARVTEFLEKAINAEIGRHHLSPNYTIAVSAGGLFEEVNKQNLPKRGGNGPDFA